MIGLKWSGVTRSDQSCMKHDGIKLRVNYFAHRARILFINRAAMGRARFLLCTGFFLTARPWAERGSCFTRDLFTFFNRAAMGRARFLFYTGFIFF